MKIKRNSLIGLLLGFVVLFIGAIIPLISWNIHSSHNGAVGIVGGAESGVKPPRYSFMLFRTLDGLPFALIVLGIALIVLSGFCLIFSKTVKAHCNIKTTAISLGLSCAGALGVSCFLTWLGIYLFNESSKYPIRYPVSIVLGYVCFFSFVALFVLYFIVKTNESIKSTIIDVLTSIVCFPAFFFIFNFLENAIT